MDKYLIVLVGVFITALVLGVIITYLHYTGFEIAVNKKLKNLLDQEEKNFSSLNQKIENSIDSNSEELEHHYREFNNKLEIMISNITILNRNLVNIDEQASNIFMQIEKQKTLEDEIIKLKKIIKRKEK